jgi:hypothetical protein
MIIEGVPVAVTGPNYQRGPCVELPGLCASIDQL